MIGEGFYKIQGIGTPCYERTLSDKLFVRATVRVFDQDGNFQDFLKRFWLTTDKGTAYSLNQLEILGCTFARGPEDLSGFGAFYAVGKIKISTYDGALELDGVYADMPKKQAEKADLRGDVQRLKAAIAANRAEKADGPKNGKRAAATPVKENDEELPF